MADAVLLEPSDLQAFDSEISDDIAERMIRYATARAFRIAPCLRSATGEVLDEAQGILVGALRRQADQGSGALQHWTNVDGPFTRTATVDTRTGTSRGLFYPSEEADLRALCAKTTKRARSGWLL